MSASPQIEPSHRVPLRRAPAPPPRESFWERFAALALRRPLAFILLAVVAFAAAAPGAVHLYRDLRTDLRELLPQGAPAAVALEELERRIGGLAQLAILIRSDDLRAGERFVDALEARLSALPPTMVRQVKAHVNEEKRFLLEHGALYLDVKDLQRFRQSLQRAKAAKNPLAVDLSEEQSDPTALDPAAEAAIAKADHAFAEVDRFTDGYLVGEDGKTFVVLVSPPSVALSLHANQQLLAAVQHTVDDLQPKKFHPSIHVGYGGEVTQVIEAQAALVHDLELSSVLVLLAVSLALFFYYRTIWSIPLLVVPLFTGICITFALSRLAIHYLNPSTAFLGSIIIGNGINAGIILLARYLEDRRRGVPLEKALPDALSMTWLPTLVASLAAAASYGSLCATKFRGFNQFGLMGIVGMTLCWIASYVLMPPLIVLLERAHPRGLVMSEHKAPVGRLSARFAPLPARYARPIVLGSIAIALLSSLGIARFVREPFEYDFTKLGSRRGEKNGAEYWNHHLDAVLKVNQSPAVVLTDSPEQAKKVAEALDRVREQEGPNSTIDSVQSLQKLVPEDQDRKLELLRSVFKMLTPNVVKSLPERVKPSVQRMLQYTVLRPVTLDDVPQQQRQIFRERDGSVGKLVLVYTSPTADARSGKAQLAHARRIREVALQAVPTARVAGSVILTSDILSSITGDGALAAGLSFLAVAVFTLLLLRSMRDAGWVLTSLCLGVVWLGGAIAAMGLRFNFVNFVVLPITFGIGIDYAVNFYKRYTVSRSVEEALAGAGGAVALCSTTTIIGYSALLIADNRAIFSFGLMAVVGELACLTAALVTLPALLALRR